jgi:hypothetical protein
MVPAKAIGRMLDQDEAAKLMRTVGAWELPHRRCDDQPDEA